MTEARKKGRAPSHHTEIVDVVSKYSTNAVQRIAFLLRTASRITGCGTGEKIFWDVRVIIVEEKGKTSPDCFDNSPANVVC